MDTDGTLLLPPDTRTALKLHPGDRVLLTFASIDQAYAHELRDKLHARFPGVEFTLVGGITGLAHMPALPE